MVHPVSQEGPSLPPAHGIVPGSADSEKPPEVQLDSEEQGKESVDALQDEGFVEGGFRGWLNVFGAFVRLGQLVIFSTFGYSNAFGVYQSYYQTHQYASMSPSAIAWLGSVAVWLEFSSALITGPLFDRGYFRSSLAAGSCLFVFVLFMTSLAKTFWQSFLAQGVGMGIAMGFTYVPTISVLSHYFRERRNVVMGIAIMGSSVGGICYPILLNSTFERIGFAKGVQTSGYLVLGCLLIANLVLRPRPPKVQLTQLPSKRATPKDILSELRYSVAVAACFFATLSNFFPIYFIQTFFQISAAPAFGRVIATFTADKIGTLNVMFVFCCAASVLTFTMFGATNNAGAIIFAILYGFFSGGIFALMSPVFVALSTDVSEIGLRQGVAFVVSGLAALIGPPISGALLSAANNNFR